MPKDFYNDFNTTAIATNQKRKVGRWTRAFQATLLGLINLGLVWASFRTLIDGISFKIENNYHTIVKRAVFQLSMQILLVTSCGYNYLDFLTHYKICQN